MLRVSRRSLPGPLVAVALLAFGCNPPLPENEAPSVRVLSPTGILDRDSGATSYRADANTPIPLTLVLRDRDGDSPLDVHVYIDPTPDTDDDPVEVMDEVASALAQETVDLLDDDRVWPPEIDEDSIPKEDVGAVVELSIPNGLPEGAQVVVIEVSDNKEVNAIRRARLAFNVNPSLTPPVVEIQNDQPGTQDALVGVIVTDAVDPEGGTPFHEWRWINDATGVLAPPDAPGSSFPGTLPAVQTTKDDVWRFCVTAWDTEDGTPPSEGERTTLAHVESCDQVTVVNTPPGPPGAASVRPQGPNPATPIRCVRAGDATDPDGDPVTYAFSWSVNGTAVAGATDEWLSPTHTVAGDQVLCTITASDAEIGANADSSPVTVEQRVQTAITRASRQLRGENSTLAPPDGDRAGLVLATADLRGVSEVVIGLPNKGFVASYRTGSVPALGDLNQNDSPQIRLTDEDGFGRAATGADLDGDGLLDLIVAGEGVARVLYGGDVMTDFDFSAAATPDAEIAVAGVPGFGTAVALGDLRSASVVGEVVVSEVVPGQANVVRVFNGDLIVPMASLDDTDAIATITGVGTDDGFGETLAIGGDVTGDAFVDLVVGDPVTGEIRVFSGGPTLNGTLTAASASTVITGAPADELGATLAVADIDGDGTGDLVIGAPGVDTVAVYFGGALPSTLTFPAGADVQLTGTAATRFGASLGIYPSMSPNEGDTVVVGAPLAGNGEVGLYLGPDLASASGPVTLADAAAVFSESATGGALRTAPAFPHLDSDGVPDLVLAAPHANGNEGLVYVMLTTP